MINTTEEMKGIRRLASSIREYQETIKVLKRSAKWIEDHKVTKPTEFYKVINQLEIWKKSKSWLILEKKKRIEIHENTLKAIEKEFKITRLEAENILMKGLEKKKSSLNPSKRS